MEEIGAKLVASGATQYIRDLQKADQATNDLAAGIAAAAPKTEKLGKAAAGAGKGVSGLGESADGAADDVEGLGKTSRDAADDVDGLGGTARGAGGMLDKLGGVAKGAAAGALGILAGAVAGVVGGLVSATERTAEFRRVLGQDFPADQIAGINDEVALLERRFGADLPSTLDAARQLVANGLAPDFASAMDIITAGFSEGLDVGQDFLDTIREYSPFFGSLGFSADDTLSIINRGLDAGARNADLVADAVKEFGILIRDPATLEAVSALDSQTGDLVRSFQEGKITGEDAFSGILARISEIEDPILRNTLGVATFGTKWEDLGEQAALALGKTDEGLISSAGAAEEAGNKITSFGEILPRIGDKLASALAPAGEAVLGFVNEHWPAFESAIDSGISTAGDFAAALGGSADAAGRLPEPLQAVVGAIDSGKGAIERFNQTPFGTELRQGAGVVADYFSGPFQEQLGRGVGVVQSKLDELAASPWGQQVRRGGEVVASYFANDFAQDFQNGVALVGKGLDTLAASDWYQDFQNGVKIAQDAFGRFGQFMLNDFPRDFTNGVQIVQAKLDEVKGWLSRAADEHRAGANTIGASIIAGIEQGLNAASGGLYATIKGIIRSALGSAESEGKIKSPSRLFAERVGAPIAEGIAQGVRERRDLVDASLADTIGGALAVAEREAPGVGLATGEGVTKGIERSIRGALRAAQKLAQAVAGEAKRTLQIGSPSRVFADEVGQPIVGGIAQGILDNLDVLLDAAQEISWAVLEEAKAFAATIESALGPLLADAFQGAADYARSKLGGLDLVDSLAPDLSEVERISQETGQNEDAIRKADEEIARLRQPLAEDPEIAKLREATDTGELDELRAQIAREQTTAAQNLDPAKRAAAQERLIKLNRKLAEEQAAYDAAEAKRKADLEAAVKRQQDAELKRQQELAAAETQRRFLLEERTRLAERYAAAEVRVAEQRRIQEQAMADLRAAQEAAMAIEDPAERARFLQLRTQQIGELAREEQALAAATTDAERERIRERIAYLKEAQAAEGALYAAEAEERRRNQEAAFRDAEDALEQLKNLIYFSQQDMAGVGSDAIRGVAAGMLAELERLSTTLGGAFDSVIADMKQQLGIASPSRLFAEAIGAPLAQGIGAGFEAELSRLAPSLALDVAGIARPAASAASISYQNLSSSSLTINNDLRGAAPGVGAEVYGATQRALSATGRRADILTRTR